VFFKGYCQSKLTYFFSVLAVIAGFSLAMPQNANANPKYASLIIDADTGVVLHQENAGQYRYPASLVKMMTLYMTFQALENGSLSMDERVSVSSHAARQAPSSMYFKAGSSVAVKDAVMAVVIKSANDAAVVLGEAVSGSESQFAADMNKMAKRLGMEHTTFRNASGLPDPRQITTAYDLARLAVALRRDYPQYYGLFNKDQFTYNGHVYGTHNRVTKNYQGADGIKTGYVRASGFNLVTSATRNGKSLVGVVLGGRSYASRDQQMISLLDRSFSGSIQKADNSNESKGLVYTGLSPNSEVKEKVKSKKSVSSKKSKSQTSVKKSGTNKKVATKKKKKTVTVASVKKTKNAKITVKKKPVTYASLDE
jgi:D-alanyl-D-alanine carboxypeptidase